MDTSLNLSDLLLKTMHSKEKDYISVNTEHELIAKTHDVLRETKLRKKEMTKQNDATYHKTTINMVIKIEN
jgi:hypothetical protein